MGGLVQLEESFDDEELIAIVLTPIRTAREGDTRSDIVDVVDRSLQKQQDQQLVKVEKVVLDQDELDHQYNCVTPTTEAALLKPALVCPPAPRKKSTVLPTKVLKRRKLLPELEPLPDFFVDVPEDLESCFIPIIRSSRNVVCKKIRRVVL